jgi:hypothetical protein
MVLLPAAVVLGLTLATACGGLPATSPAFATAPSFGVFTVSTLNMWRSSSGSIDKVREVAPLMSLRHFGFRVARCFAFPYDMALLSLICPERGRLAADADAGNGGVYEPIPKRITAPNTAAARSMRPPDCLGSSFS